MSKSEYSQFFRISVAIFSLSLPSSDKRVSYIPLKLISLIVVDLEFFRFVILSVISSKTVFRNSRATFFKSPNNCFPTDLAAHAVEITWNAAVNVCKLYG